ncbi:MAG TPA: hypothetical protein VJ652_08225 [Noviherbaspirillum sp.]|nr:hypothetical protein [Noviherbaspirillum sp.]
MTLGEDYVAVDAGSGRRAVFAGIYRMVDDVLGEETCTSGAAKAVAAEG